MTTNATITPERPATLPRAPPSVDERRARGKAARAGIPRSAHAAWSPPTDRPDPLALLRAEDESRVPGLLPIRYGRMSASPFTFFRGSAGVMAADLAGTPISGLRAQLCGDAHLSNFGAFAAPDRQLVFSLNDFDETLPGPWEWDVKRLAASLSLAGRDRGFGTRQRRTIVEQSVRAYREAMREFSRMRYVDVWYARLDVDAITARWGGEVSHAAYRRFSRNVAKAHQRDSTLAMERLTEVVDGQVRIVSDPPLIVPIADEAPGLGGTSAEVEVRSAFDAYRDSVAGATRRLIDRYHYVDAARKVVGVGSVGTRAWVVLMLGDSASDPLFLQLKEAGPSVLEPYAGRSEYRYHGRRVVEGQWLMQASSDIFLGWIRMTGLDGRRRDFYVRQLWDWKRSAKIELMDADTLSVYGQMCGWTLARAHARSGDPVAIGAYLGSGSSFDVAVTEFAELYADQAERDFNELRSAIERGEIAAIEGV